MRKYLPARLVTTLLFFSLGTAGCGKQSATQKAAHPEVDTSPVASCGRPPLQACPLQQWMSANLGQPFNRGRLERLIRPFEDLARAGPPGYPRWVEFATAGAAAATRKDLDGVRMACEGCHQTYRDSYRSSAARNLPLADVLKTAS